MSGATPQCSSAEPLPGSAEACDYFVGGEEHIVPVADLADAREVVIGWDDDSADADHRLGEKHRDGVGAFADDRVFQVGRLMAAPTFCIGRGTIGVRRGNVYETRNAGLEERPISGNPVALIAASVVPW